MRTVTAVAKPPDTSLRAMWNLTGKKRPSFAGTPAQGQESVWDYPRPPSLRADARLVEVKHDGQLIASSNRTFRVCETASPPTFYIPPDDVNRELLIEMEGNSYCEWKGTANYWGLQPKPEAGPVAWSYRKPRHPFMKVKGYMSFYPGRVECYVDGERVRPQPGGFYGGWITDEIIGPFKGEPGTGHW